MTRSHRLLQLDQKETTLTVSPANLVLLLQIEVGWSQIALNQPFLLKYKKPDLITSHLRNAVCNLGGDVQRETHNPHSELELAFLTRQTVMSRAGELMHDNSYDWSKLPSLTYCSVTGRTTSLPVT